MLEQSDSSSISCVKKLKQYRYIVYVIMLAICFQEAISRSGMPMVMVGGMIKQNCSDPLDTGIYCWSENVKASVLGSFFYTYCLQIPVTMVARRIGYPVMLKVYFLISALMMSVVPWLIHISPYLVIISQAVRGFSAPILISYNFEFVRVWTVREESLVYLAASGGTWMFGTFAGGAIAGSMTVTLGWESYFYFCGVSFMVIFVLYQLFISPDPSESRYMTQEEKDLYVRSDSATEECVKKESYFKLLQRSYLIAFCMSIFCSEIVISTILANIPFYLKEVLNMRTEDISLTLLLSGVGVMLGTIASSKIIGRFDKCHLSWLTRRRITAFTPQILQTILLLLIPNIDNIPGTACVVVLLALGFSSLFSGYIYSICYELDPFNSPAMCSVFNCFGQVAGFIAPLLREYITRTDKFDPNYQEVYRGKWRMFFYTCAGFPVVGIICMLMSQLLRKKEWVSFVEKSDSVNKKENVVPNDTVILPRNE